MAKWSGGTWVAGILVFASMGCTDRCFLCKNDKSSAIDAKSVSKRDSYPRPANWPPEQGATNLAAAPSKTSPVSTVGATPVSNESKPNPIQVASQNSEAMDGVQKIETVPYRKITPPPGTPTPSANPDPQKLPIISDASSPGASLKDVPLNPSTGGSSLTIPPPPPGSNMLGSAPIGIPTPPSPSPNR